MRWGQGSGGGGTRSHGQGNLCEARTRREGIIEGWNLGEGEGYRRLKGRQDLGVQLTNFFFPTASTNVTKISPFKHI